MNFPVDVPLGKGVEVIVIWLTDNFATVFGTLSVWIRFFLVNIDRLFNWVPWPITIIIVSILAVLFSGRRMAIFSAFGLFLLGCMGLWAEGMSTMARVVTAVFISVLFGLPVGVLAAKDDKFESLLRPILDGMQTIPSFVYLVPAIMFFGIGAVPGVMATCIFSLPPMVRMTNLGIRQVNYEVVEAGHAFGSTPWQLLLKIQLPLALPSIMTGVNQTVMMSLSMTVTAAMIGAGGLGDNILYSIQRVDLKVGVDAGVGILLIAMILDRILQGLTKRQQKAIYRKK